ncbi:MAG TPA: glycosyltransferase family 39 protein, partial [Phnomibacter sp.]|nr:glycosyltransferase family 39 protein [Phnomibacter sp.]
MNALAEARQFERWFWWLMAIAAVLLLVRLGAAPIYILDEAKNAQCAREMWHNGDWIVPTFNGQLRTDKPALHYWFMGLSYSVAGVGPAQARFFSAVLGLATLFVTYTQVRRYSQPSVAFFSALALVLSPHFLFEFRLSVPDPYLIFFTTAGLFAGFGFIEKGSRAALMVCAVSLGLAVLAKGPVAIALPGVVFLLYIWSQKKWRVLWDPILLVALVVLLAIAFPWYVLVHQQTDGAFTRGFFLEHNLDRFSSEKEGHGGPFIITPLIVLVGMLPFSLAALHAIFSRFGYSRHPLFLFSALVVGVYVVFFSISSTKLPNYPMPCYPFVAIMAAYLLHDVYSKRFPLPKYLWWVWVGLGLVIPIAAFMGIRAEMAVAGYSWLAYPILLLPIGILVAYSNKVRVIQWIMTLSATWIFFSAFFLWVGYPLIYRQDPVTHILNKIGEENTLVAYKAYNPAFNFNLSAPDRVIPVFANAADLVVDATQKKAQLAGVPYFVITRQEHLPDLEGSGFVEVVRRRDLFELPTTVILVWR